MPCRADRDRAEVDGPGFLTEEDALETTLTVTYYHHAGFSVTDGTVFLLFDYWRGENDEMNSCPLTGNELTGYKRVYVFVSNDREDHFDENVFTWDRDAPNITYLIAGDIDAEHRKKARGLEMNPGDELKLEGVDIHAYATSDRGVSLLVTLDDLKIFYAGELNLWHWREESSLSEIQEAERAFENAMAPIEKLHVDLAMFPLDPRMGGLFDAGANHFIMSVKPRLFIPMQWHGRKNVASEYARRGRTRYTEILALTSPREQAQVTYRDSSITWKILPPSLPNEVSLDSLAQDDPFADSDLPVALDTDTDRKKGNTP